MASTNKHKSVGPKKKPVKQPSWWTAERIKAMLCVCAVLVVVAIGIGVYQYVSGLQSSVVGTWTYAYTDDNAGDDMNLKFIFGEDKSVEIIRDRNGENEADMVGTYSIDDQWDYLVIVLGDETEGYTMLTYSYKCKGDSLKMKDIDRGTSYDCKKVK